MKRNTRLTVRNVLISLCMHATLQLDCYFACPVQCSAVQCCASFYAFSVPNPHTMVIRKDGKDDIRSDRVY